MILARAHLALAASFRTRPAAEIVVRVAEDEADTILSRLGADPAQADWARVVADVRRAADLAVLPPAPDAQSLEDEIRRQARAALVASVRRRSPEGARVVPVGSGLEIELDGAYGFARIVNVAGAQAA